MPTDPNRRIAEAKGWTDCHATGGLPCGIAPGTKDPEGHEALPDYTGDPREYVPLLEEIARDPSVCDVTATLCMDDAKLWCTVDITRWKQYHPIAAVHDTKHGHAVALAWLAWAAAKENSHAS